MDKENKIISGFWLGPALTNIQKLCVRSFQDNGHQFDLYTYIPVAGVPSGVHLRDASEIVKWKERERFQNDANFSDYFRSNLTALYGGWYVDMDIVCLQPFDFPQERVFVSEWQFGGPAPQTTTPLVNGCIIKIPAGDPMTAAILERISQLDTKTCGWIDVGPKQYRWGVDHFNYRDSIQHPDVFDGLWPDRLWEFVNSEQPFFLPEAAKAIHLRTSYWKPGTVMNPNGKFSPGSMFEILKRRHGVV